MKKLRFKLLQLKETFWFIPTLLILAVGLGAAMAFLALDYRWPLQSGAGLQQLFTADAASGRSVLSIIAGSMVGIAGTVFSITLVILQLASSQFGPRLLKNFMYKRLNQVVLGQYVATFLYCIIVLNSIQDQAGSPFVPKWSILFALLLSVVNIFLLVIFIHDISTSIYPGKIVNQLREKVEQNVRQLYPDKDRVEPDHEEDGSSRPDLVRIRDMVAQGSGYLQYIDLDILLEIACAGNLILRVLPHPGEYVLAGQPILTVYKAEGEEIQLPPDTKWQEFYALDAQKSLFQDTEFAIHQIVEIGARALSPGVNDPFTAINCIDNLASVLGILTQSHIPGPHIRDAEGAVRLMVNRSSFEGFLKASFDQLRQFGAGSPSVIIRLMETLLQIHGSDRNHRHTATLLQYADLVLETGKESFLLSSDFEDLQNRYFLLQRATQLP